MAKKLYIIIVVIIAAALVGFWWWSSRRVAEAPFDTSDISQELQGLDIGDIDEEFEQIDRELDTL